MAICFWRPKEKDIGPLPRCCTASVHLLHDASLTSAEKLLQQVCGSRQRMKTSRTQQLTVTNKQKVFPRSYLSPYTAPNELRSESSLVHFGM